MAGLMGRLAKFARSPQGQKLAGQAKRAAKDPGTRRKIEDARRRFGRKR